MTPYTWFRHQESFFFLKVWRMTVFDLLLRIRSHLASICFDLGLLRLSGTALMKKIVCYCFILLTGEIGFLGKYLLTALVFQAFMRLLKVVTANLCIKTSLCFTQLSLYYSALKLIFRAQFSLLEWFITLLTRIL